jgi:oligoendopeptidase F
MSTPPRWDMTNVYPSLESRELATAVKEYKNQVAALRKFFDNKLSLAGPRTPSKTLAPLVEQAIDRINRIETLSGTIVPFIYSYITTDSRNALANRLISEFEKASLPMDKLYVRLRRWLGKLEPRLEQIMKRSQTAREHALMLREAAQRSRYQMSDDMEGLAAELSLSGATAFEKLHGTVTSQLAIDFELDGQVKKMPMPAIINLRSRADEDTRRRAYEAEHGGVLERR